MGLGMQLSTTKQPTKKLPGTPAGVYNFVWALTA